MAHTCSATDRQFIRVAELNMIALGDWGQNYREGAATAKRSSAKPRRRPHAFRASSRAIRR